MVKWVECPRCTHKLFRLDIVQPDSKADIQIKCDGCKAIIRVLLDGEFDWEAVEE